MLKFYVFLYGLLQEISVNLIILKIKLPKDKVFNGLARVMLTKAEREARRLNEHDLWLLKHLSKEMTSEKYRDNPWTYQETLEKKLCSNSFSKTALSVRLRQFEIWKIAEKGESKTNRKLMWRLTDYGRKVSEAFEYINWKCPELHQESPGITPPK